LDFNVFGIRSWRDCCRVIYMKEMWKKLALQYQFQESIKLRSSNDSNSTNGGTTDAANVENTNDLRVHFIADESNARMYRYLTTIMKNCRVESSDKHDAKKMDRRMAVVRGRNTPNDLIYNIQCLVGTKRRGNCVCKFICLDMSDTSFSIPSHFTTDEEILTHFQTTLINKEEEESINEFIKSRTDSSRVVVCALSHQKKYEINPDMFRVAKALSTFYSLPYIEIDVGRCGKRGELLFYYAIHFFSKRMDHAQLPFFRSIQVDNEW